jgi:heterodisulfide reductase subunit C
MASEMKLKTHEVIRYIQNDDRRKLYDDDSIWLCVACETCTARCPNEVDPARMLDSLREIVLRDNPSQAPRAIQSFHEAFLGQVRSHGRLFEFGLVASYKMRTGKLFEDVLATPGMISRGKLAFVPTRIRGAADVRRIMDEAIALSKEEAK